LAIAKEMIEKMDYGRRKPEAMIYTDPHRYKRIFLKEIFQINKENQ